MPAIDSGGLTMIDALQHLIGQQLVIDTMSAWLYIGKLDKLQGKCAVLVEVDVYDSSQSTTTKEKYILDSIESGVKVNRSRVYLNLDHVISFSLLDDVIQF